MKATLDDIKNFVVGEGSESLTFMAKLARENAWSEVFARRAYEEYLRFIYLAAASEAPVTPSDAVDQVWHLHLCYSKSYWNDLCGDLLGKQIHHAPSRGGIKEAAKLEAQYETTMQLYTKTF